MAPSTPNYPQCTINFTGISRIHLSCCCNCSLCSSGMACTQAIKNAHSVNIRLDIHILSISITEAYIKCFFNQQHSHIGNTWSNTMDRPKYSIYISGAPAFPDVGRVPVTLVDDNTCQITDGFWRIMDIAWSVMQTIKQNCQLFKRHPVNMLWIQMTQVSFHIIGNRPYYLSFCASIKTGGNGKSIWVSSNEFCRVRDCRWKEFIRSYRSAECNKLKGHLFKLEFRWH